LPSQPEITTCWYEQSNGTGIEKKQMKKKTRIEEREKGASIRMEAIE